MKKIFLLSTLTVLLAGCAVAQTDTSYSVRPKDTTVVRKVNRKQFLALNGDGIYFRDSTWKIGGFLGFNVAQTALYQWSPGGTNSFSMLFAGNFYVQYKKKKVSWDTHLDMKYGMVANGLIRDQDLAQRNLQKNIDMVEFNTNIGYDFSDHLYFSGKLDFLSQFSPTYDYSQTDTAHGQFKRYVVSKFAAPAILTLGPGFTWKPKSYFTMFFTPIEGKMTFVTGALKDTAKSDANSSYYYGVDPTRFGLNAGTNYSAAVGAEIDILFQKDIVKTINWKSHLNVFISYYNNNYNTTMPYFDKADTLMTTTHISTATEHIPAVTWDNDIIFKLYKFLTATLSTRFVYQYNAVTPVDKVHNSTSASGPDGLTDVDKTGAPILTYNKLQIFEQFGVGLSFKF
jgi:hypothetical protein